MTPFLTALLVAVSALFVGRAEGGDKVVMCYFTSWAQYRSGVGKFVPEDIDPNLCTHILFAFGRVHQTSLTIQNSEANLVSRVTSLRQANPKLKVLLALGGASGGNEGFNTAASSAEKSGLFAENVVAYLRQHGFDGLDMDWEKPAPNQKSNFTMMLAELRSAFDAEAQTKNRTRLELTAALWSLKTVVENIYEVDKIHQYLDYAVVMAYDFHGSWDATLGHNSPLYVPDYEKDGPALLSQNATMFWWEALGCPREKLVMGLATYGRSFRMTSANLNKPGDAYSKGNTGNAGPITRTAGHLAYYEVSQLLDAGFTRVFDDVCKVPYAYGERNGHYEWISYDDTESMRVKADYIVNTGLGGAMFWTLDFDDFKHNVSRLGRYPLISTVSNIFRAASTAAPTATTTASPATIATSTTSTAITATDTAIVDGTTSSVQAGHIPTRFPRYSSTASPTDSPTASSTAQPTDDPTGGSTVFRQSVAVLVLAALTSEVLSHL